MAATLTAAITPVAVTIVGLLLEYIECAVQVRGVPLLEDLSFVDLLIGVPLFTEGLYFFIALRQLDK